MSKYAALENKADRLWQQAICKMWLGMCGWCKKQQGDSGHHIIKRRFRVTRWALMNGIYLCAECHRKAEIYPKPLLDYLRFAWPLHHNWHLLHQKLPIDPMFREDYDRVIKELKTFVEAAP